MEFFIKGVDSNSKPDIVISFKRKDIKNFDNLSELEKGELVDFLNNSKERINFSIEETIKLLSSNTQKTSRANT